MSSQDKKDIVSQQTVLKWKETINEGYLPFTNLSALTKEMTQKESKGIKNFTPFD